MTALARHIADIDDLKSFYSAADIRFGCGLYRIANPDVGNSCVGTARISRLLARNWHHPGDIELVSNKLVQVQRPVFWMPELQIEGLPPPQSPAQRKTEETK
jgi:hypothetical protein